MVWDENESSHRSAELGSWDCNKIGSFLVDIEMIEMGASVSNGGYCDGGIVALIPSDSMFSQPEGFFRNLGPNSAVPAGNLVADSAFLGRSSCA